MSDLPVAPVPDRPPLLGSRRQFLIGAGCLTAAAVAFVRKPRAEQAFLGSAQLEDLVPHQFAGWQFVTASGLVLPPQDQLKSKIYHQLVTRVYNRSGGPSVMLLIAYGGSQDGVIQIHRPEICYPASGFTLTTVKDHVALLAPGIRIPSRFIVADSPTRKGTDDLLDAAGLGIPSALVGATVFGIRAEYARDHS